MDRFFEVFSIWQPGFILKFVFEKIKRKHYYQHHLSFFYGMVITVLDKISHEISLKHIVLHKYT